MSLILLEGFDDGLRNQRWTQEAGGAFPNVSSSTENRLGLSQPWGAGVHQGTTHNLIAGDEHATLTVGFWMHVTGLPTTISGGERHMLGFLANEATTIHVTINVSTSGQLQVRRGGTTLLGTTDIVFSPNTSHYLEIRVTLHDTTGAVTIWVDGNVALSLTNIDTKNGGADAVFDAVRFANLRQASGGLSGESDDIYITNGAGASPYNSNLGDVIIDTIFPNDNGAYSDFVGSDIDSVDNYLLVDESPSHDSDTTYVESNTDTDRDSYEFENIETTSGVIFGIVTTAVARNIGTADNLQISTRIASTDYNSATIAAPAGYDASLRKVWQVSPATGLNWTVAEINAAEFGIENVA